jgi:hypothetical protein
MNLPLVSRAALHAALLRSEYKDLSLWVCYIRLEILLLSSASPSATNEQWLSLARQADSAVLPNKAEWKGAPGLYVQFTLDQARALMRAGALADGKRTLGTLRSVPSAKHTWDFFKLLAVIEAKQGSFEYVQLRASRFWFALTTTLLIRTPSRR